MTQDEKHKTGKWWINRYIRYYHNFKPTRYKYTDYFYHKLPSCVEEIDANIFEFKQEYREDL